MAAEIKYRCNHQAMATPMTCCEMTTTNQALVTGAASTITDQTAASPPTDSARLLPFEAEPLESLYAVTPNELGHGEFGVVHTCMHRATGQLRACKTVDKARLVSGGRSGDLEMELYCMGALPPHPHVVQLASVHEDEACVHMVMDLCDGGDLFDLVSQAGRLPESFSADVFRQVADAVSFCHSHGVLHLDIKPENMLICGGGGSLRCQSAKGAHVDVKLADFGQAVILTLGQVARGLAGSSFYMAPEVVCGRTYDASADVWSMGVLLYVMLAGYLPFYGDSLPETFLAICINEADLESAPWPSVSEEAKHLIRWMLSVDPQKRPTASHVLSHPWVVRRTTMHQGGRQGLEAQSNCVTEAQAADCCEPDLQKGCQGGMANVAADQVTASGVTEVFSEINNVPLRAGAGSFEHMRRRKDRKSVV